MYTAFLESGDWAVIPNMQAGGYLTINPDGLFEITGTSILDFDGDGVLDLWFRAESVRRRCRFTNSAVITGFATIVDGEVVQLLHGYITGGSIGGTFVTARFNTETSEHLIMRGYFSGGWGGRSSGANLYSMHNGELTLEYWFERRHYMETIHEEAKELFWVNGEEVSEDDYNQFTSRFEWPSDDALIWESRNWDCDCDYDE